MKNIVFSRFALLSLSLFVMACTPTQSNRGNMVEDFRLSELTPGISTRNNVLRSLGSPTAKAPFDENTWYYLGQKMEQKGIFIPEVKEERIIVAAFDDEGILQRLEELERDRIDVPTVDRETPTGGNEITVVEQILGNVGRFNKVGETSGIEP
ncbi:MAG: outer membrane protein assembly factor BamE [Pseudomonadota bacterium]